jgi:hypothetical protein
MAQQDATEQVKEFLRQLIKYRFWISIGLAALFAVIAYTLGSSPVKAKATAETNAILDAEKTVKKYQAAGVPTDQYKPIVEEKTAVLTTDVNKAWKELFDRQKDLLTWPDTVHERFTKWGRKWPENEDPGKVNLAIVDYIYAYPAYLDMVFKTFHPFNYETGEGIVASAPKEALLRPVSFQIEHLPDIGKVWAAQERLWVQHTMLDVIAKVNKKAKDWDSAIIKEITMLEVGNPVAQDQRSLAKGETLAEAPAIVEPGKEAQAEAAASGGAGGGAADSMAGGMMQYQMLSRRGRDSGMGSPVGASGGGAGGQYDETIYYITPQNDKGQYKILPVVLTVLIDQDRVQDLLVELENSPMSIQVMDFELQRSPSRVTKPEKGTQSAFAGMGMGGGGGQMMGQMMMMRRMDNAMSGVGYGGNMMMMNQQMRMQMRGMMERGGSYMQSGMGMGLAGGGSGTERKGVDQRGVNREKARTQKEEEIAKSRGPILVDPYYDIVEVKVYGQARFFNPPPADEPAAEPSPGEATAAAGAGAPAQGATEAGATKAAAPPQGGAGAPAQPSGGPADKATGGEPGKATAGATEKPAGGEAEKPAEDAKPAPDSAPAGAGPAEKPSAPAEPPKDTTPKR